jgi:hypothetical protein
VKPSPSITKKQPVFKKQSVLEPKPVLKSKVVPTPMARKVTVVKKEIPVQKPKTPSPKLKIVEQPISVKKPIVVKKPIPVKKLRTPSPEIVIMETEDLVQAGLPTSSVSTSDFSDNSSEFSSENSIQSTRKVAETTLVRLKILNIKKKIFCCVLKQTRHFLVRREF